MALTEIPSELSSTPSIVDGGNATAITIGSDESVALGGNFIVGATSAFASSSFCVDPTGLGQFRRDGTPLIVRRDGSQGDLISFEDDGATVGSIGTGSGLLTIGKGTGNLVFENALIAPCSDSSVGSSNGVVDLGASSRRFKDLWLSGGVRGTSTLDITIPETAGGAIQLEFGNNTNTTRRTVRAYKDNFEPVAADDGVIGLGAAGTRFKDLYLSGGAYLGGTAAANKLDDYEGGEFDPTVTNSDGNMSGISYVSQIGYYQKIGDLVWFRLQVGFSATTIGTGNFRITNLPFNSLNNSQARQSASVLTYNLDWDANWKQIHTEGLVNSNGFDFLIARDATVWANLKATDMANSTTYYYIVSGCYVTN